MTGAGRKAGEGENKSLARHPERSEGSLQLPFAQVPAKNCRDASLRSA
jgi:hypothetical protein